MSVEYGIYMVVEAALIARDLDGYALDGWTRFRYCRNMIGRNILNSPQLCSLRYLRVIEVSIRCHQSREVLMRCRV